MDFLVQARVGFKRVWWGLQPPDSTVSRRSRALSRIGRVLGRTLGRYLDPSVLVDSICRPLPQTVGRYLDPHDFRTLSVCLTIATDSFGTIERLLTGNPASPGSTFFPAQILFFMSRPDSRALHETVIGCTPMVPSDRGGSRGVQGGPRWALSWSFILCRLQPI